MGHEGGRLTAEFLDERVACKNELLGIGGREGD